MILSSMGLVGGFPDNIGSLAELTVLDLSFNPNLTGNISPELGDLSKLKTLTFELCGFNGSIPKELGNAAQLSYISMALNKLTGEIPSTIGKLTNLRSLDLGGNLLAGPIPVSTSDDLGLDQLENLHELILDNNKLYGSLPKELFSPEKVLSTLNVYGNQLTGEIPDTLYNVKTLEYLELRGNSFTGSISSSINTLPVLRLLGLNGNNFTGPIPDLTGMDSLTDVFVGNNSFDRSVTPGWVTSLRNLEFLYLGKAALYGPIPQAIFSIPLLKELNFEDNEFNGTLDMTYVTSPVLEIVNFEGNKISEFKSNLDSNRTILLSGNPYCEVSANAEMNVCKPLKI